MLNENDAFKEGWIACQEVYEHKRCNTCAYAKTSGDTFICDLGVLENKVWGNSWTFGCTKYKRSES